MELLISIELSGLTEFREVGGVGLKLRQGISLIESHHLFETSSCGNKIMTCFVDRGEKAEDGGFSRLVAELDIVLRGVVQAALGPGEIALV